MKFVSREKWGATGPQGSTPIPGPVKGTTCHWEGPKMGWPWPHRQCARKVRAIERFHVGTRKWAGIAYNALVCPHGYVFEGRGVNVRSAANGVSSIGGNDQWYAVCYLAGQGDKFTDAGKRGMRDAIEWLRRKGGAGRSINVHSDHHATLCPGEQISRWVRGGARRPAVKKKPAPTPAPEPTPPPPPEPEPAPAATVEDALRQLATLQRNVQRNSRRLRETLEALQAQGTVRPARKAV